MNLFDRLARTLQNARRVRVAPKLDNVRTLPAMARATVPLTNMPRLGEIDGPTVRLPRPGDPGVNDGPRYTPRTPAGRHRAPDNNQVPARFTRQQVA